MCARGKTPDVLKEEKKRKRDQLHERFGVAPNEAVELDQAAFVATASLEDVLAVITTAVKAERKMGALSWGEDGLRLDHDVLIQTDGGDLGQQSLTLFGVTFSELEDDGGAASQVRWAFGDGEEEEFEFRVWF